MVSRQEAGYVNCIVLELKSTLSNWENPQRAHRLAYKSVNATQGGNRALRAQGKEQMPKYVGSLLEKERLLTK